MKFLVALLLALNIAFAQNLNSEFKPSTAISQIKEGDLLEATIRVWPIDSADLSQFKKLEKTVFFNVFYLAQITSLGVSPNNADVVELRGLFIVKSTKAQAVSYFKYNDQQVELQLGQVKINALAQKTQNFIVLDQSLNSSYLSMIFGLLVVVLVAVLVWKRQKIKEFIQKIRPDATRKARKKYDDLFRAASKREDFEKLYLEKDQWLRLLENQAPAHNEFFKIINTHQYKKEWSNEDYSDVRSSFDVIRRSFEK